MCFFCLIDERKVNIDSGNGMALSGNKPVPVLTKI